MRNKRAFVKNCYLLLLCLPVVRSAIVEVPSESINLNSIFDCSWSQPDGTCQPDVYSNERRCVDGTCKNKCSSYYTDGFCDQDENGNVKKCIEGECQSLCSKTAPDGYCSYSVYSGKVRCVDGVCRDRCSLFETNGYCDDDLYGYKMKCVNGNCKNRCSLFETNGYCDDDVYGERKCVNGYCKSKCSRLVKDGYCENGKGCKDGQCVRNCSLFEPNGYCPSTWISTKKCYKGTCKGFTGLPPGAYVGIAIGVIIMVAVVAGLSSVCRYRDSSTTGVRVGRIVHAPPSQAAAPNFTTISNVNFGGNQPYPAASAFGPNTYQNPIQPEQDLPPPYSACAPAVDQIRTDLR